VLRYEAAVRRVARAVTGNAMDADDAAQEAFLSALDRIETYDRSRPFGPWLMRIASNAAIDLLRRRAVRSAEPLDERLAAPARSPAPDALFDVEGYPHAAIADILGIPEGTVRSDVFHARRALRDMLQLDDPSGEDA
jgi:RNA polymerase sigma-70 factor, ECF subfamily